DPTKDNITLSLLTKLSLLSIALILLTGTGIAGFLLHEQNKDARTKLFNLGNTTLAVLAEVGEFAVQGANAAFAQELLDRLSLNPDIAYAQLLDTARRPIAARAMTHEPPPLPAYAINHQENTVYSADVAADGKRYLDLVTPAFSGR